MVDPGNLVKADDTPLTTIVTQDPLYVYFDVHEQAMLRIRRLIQEHKVKAKSEKEVPVQISLSDEKDSDGKDIFTHQGIVDFTDNRVDLNTGTLRFRAKIDNLDQMITPGLFVKVRLPIGDQHPALMIRERSIQPDQSQKKVFVLQAKDDKGNPYFLKDKNGDPVPAYRPIAVDIGTPGVLRDGFREVTKGIKAGDWVVAVGMQKIRLGNNPLGEPNLVRARPFDPEVDASDRILGKGAVSPAAAPSALGIVPPASDTAPTGASPSAWASSRPTRDRSPATGGPPRTPQSSAGSESRSGRRGR
jgi:multidrug efflux pump subunit AcrA (membrane-fusion protein)